MGAASREQITAAGLLMQVAKYGWRKEQMKMVYNNKTQFQIEGEGNVQGVTRLSTIFYFSYLRQTFHNHIVLHSFDAIFDLLHASNRGRTKTTKKLLDTTGENNVVLDLAISAWKLLDTTGENNVVLDLAISAWKAI